MTSSNPIPSFYNNFGLDYWNNKSLSQGYAEATHELTQLVEDQLRSQSQLIQAMAGAGMGVVKLLGAIPIGLNDWAIQVVQKIPEGPKETLFTLVEVPVMGMVQGVGFVFQQMGAWIDGSLNNKNSFAIANEVTSTLGTASLLFLGGRSVVKGSHRIINTASQLKLTPQLSSQTSIATLSLDVAGLSSGAMELGLGTVLMSSSEKQGASGSGKGSPGKPQGPIDVIAKLKEQIFGRLPEPWGNRLAWGMGITGAGIAAAQVILPERCTPSTLFTKSKEALFPDLTKFKTALLAPDTEAAIAAAQELGKNGSDEAITILRQAKVEHYQVKEAIEDAFDQIAEDSGWIKKLKEAENTDDQMEAIEGLWKIGGRKATAALIEALKIELDYMMKAHLKLAIHRVKDIYWSVVADEFLTKDKNEIRWMVEKLAEQLDRRPHDHDLMLKLGDGYEVLGMNKKAKEVFEKITDSPLQEKDNVQAVANHKLGLLELKDGNLAKAIDLFQQALNYAPENDNAINTRVWTSLGKAYAQSNQLENASAAYQQAFLSLQKPDAKISFSLGNVYLIQQEYGLAILMYEEGIKLKVDQADLGEVYNNLGQSYFSIGEWSKALELFEKSLKIMESLEDRKGMATSYNNIGIMYQSQGPWSKALEFHEKSLEIQASLGDRHGMATSYGNMGNVYQLQGQWSKALELYEKSLEIQASLGDRQNIATIYGNMASIYQRQGQWSKAFEFYDKSLQIDESLGNRSGMARSYSNMGVIYQRQSEWSKALELYEKSLKIQVSLGDRSGMARSYNNMGNVYQSQGQWSKALEFYEKSLEIDKSLGDHHGIATSYNNMGLVYQLQGQWPKALEFYEKSLKIQVSLADRHGIATSYGNMGNVYQFQGQWSKALELYEKSLEIKVSLGDHHGMAMSYGNMGNMYQSQGQWPKALEFYEKSLKIRVSLADRHGMATSYNNMGIVYQSQGQWSKALELYEKSLKIRVSLGDRHGMATSYGNMGNVYESQRQWSKALEFYEKSLKIQVSLADRHGMATSYNNMGIVYQSQGQWSKALELYEKSLKIRVSLGDRHGMATSYGNMGNVYESQRQWSKALEFYEKSLKIQVSLGDRHGMATSYNNMGIVYQSQGQWSKALEFYEKSLKIRVSLGDRHGMATSYDNMALLFEKIGNIPKALEYTRKSVKLFRELDAAETATVEQMLKRLEAKVTD